MMTELSKTKDIEFLWIARNTSSTVKKASTNIKSFNDQNIAKNVHLFGGKNGTNGWTQTAGLLSSYRKVCINHP